MTEQQVGAFLGMLERWVDGRVSMRLAEDEKTQDWHERECAEVMENMASALMGIPVDMLPASLRFTDPE